jgi:hypothetical protein
MKVENTEARIHHVGKDIVLLPGDNDVDEKAWAEALKIKLVKHHVEAGTFKVKR